MQRHVPLKLPLTLTEFRPHAPGVRALTFPYTSPITLTPWDPPHARATSHLPSSAPGTVSSWNIPPLGPPAPSLLPWIQALFKCGDLGDPTDRGAAMVNCHWVAWGTGLWHTRGRLSWLDKPKWGESPHCFWYNSLGEDPRLNNEEDVSWALEFSVSRLCTDVSSCLRFLQPWLPCQGRRCPQTMRPEAEWRNVSSLKLLLVGYFVTALEKQQLQAQISAVPSILLFLACFAPPWVSMLLGLLSSVCYHCFPTPVQAQQWHSDIFLCLLLNPRP